MRRGGAVRSILALAPLLAPLLLLAACQQADNDPGPGGVTVGEARALDRAAAMIEAQTPPDPLPPSGAPEPEPEPGATGK